MSDLRELMDRARREAPAGDAAFEQLVDRRRRRRRSGRLLSAAVALAVTGAMVVAGVAVLGHRGTEAPAGPGASGGTPSSSPAASVAVGPNLVAGPGQYYYWKFAVVMPGGHATMVYWWSPDGNGRMENSITGTPSFGVPPDGKLRVGKFPVGDDLSGLSTDPAILGPQLEARSAPGGKSPRPDVTPVLGQDARTGSMVSAVEDLLSEMAPHASPELRVALYEVLRGIPTAEDLGTLPDPTGRPAVAVRITVTSTTKTFWFDAQTHLFMAEEDRPAGGAAPQAGDADYLPSYVIVESGGIVDSESETPSAGRLFFPSADHLPKA